jgi:dienelactone hydrolase
LQEEDSMIRMMIRAAVAMLAGIGAAQAQGAAAWGGGKMFVPASLSTSNAACESPITGNCVGQIKPGKHPVIVFLHGCGGPRTPSAFLNLGAIVVAPNSFAGGAACQRDARAIVQLIAQRHGDIAYAAGQLRSAAWADPAKLVLAGYSNGAQTTATYGGGEFRARVIVAWTCNNHRAPDQNGVRGAGPVLALLGTADEFYKGIGLTGDCGSAVASRGGPSQSIMIPGGTHEILDHGMTRSAVAAFIPAVIR